MLNSKEHYDLIEQFERQQSRGARLDKEPKDLWAKGYVYQDGHLNHEFIGFRKGYAYGRAVERMSAVDAPAPASTPGVADESPLETGEGDAR